MGAIVDTELLKMLLGRRIAGLREAKGMSRRALSLLIEVDPSRMLRIERGEEMPTALQVGALARVLEVSSDELLALPADDELEQPEYA